MTGRPRSEGTPQRRRWKAEDARAVLERFERSGLSLTEFCRREDLKLQRLQIWQRHLREPVSPRSFREIVVDSAPLVRVAPPFELCFVRIGIDFDDEALRRLVTVLSER
jgi:hypothetical protein